MLEEDGIQSLRYPEASWVAAVGSDRLGPGLLCGASGSPFYPGFWVPGRAGWVALLKSVLWIPVFSSLS